MRVGMEPVNLFICGFLQQDADESKERDESKEINTGKLSDCTLRKPHSILEPLPIVCTCKVSKDAMFALTKSFLYYTYENTLMRHFLRNSLIKKKGGGNGNYSDVEILNTTKTGNQQIKKLQAGSDFVTVILANNGNESTTLVLSDDGSSFTLQTGEGVVNEFMYGKTFGLLWTNENKLIRIDQKCSRGENVGMIPLQLPISTTVEAISCGKEHALVLTSDHKVLTVGGGSRGQLGNGSTDYMAKLTFVETLEPLKVQAISSGGWHSLVLSGGDMYAWGWNESGQVGTIPSPLDINDKEVNEKNISKLLFLPVLVDTPIDETFVSISTGSRHSAAVTSLGVLYTWGWNAYGQLCHGDQDNRFSPCQVTCFEKQKVIGVYCSDWATLISITVSNV